MQEQAIVLDGYKGVRVNIKSADDDFEIFDVEKDTHEAKNLAGEAGFGKLQQRMKDEVLRIRRPYDYNWKKRAPQAMRPYDGAAGPGVEVEKTVPGLNYRTAEGKFSWVPEMDTVGKITASGTSAGIKIPLEAKNSGAVEFEGYIQVPEDGKYVFFLTTDKGEGSRAFLRMHGMQLVDADNQYKPGTTVNSSAATAATEAGNKTGIRPEVTLKAGKHPIRLGYIRTAGSEAPSLKLEWRKPGDEARSEVPQEVFIRSQQ